MGLTRVILSRELSLEEIEGSAIRCRIWRSRSSFTVRCAGLLRSLPALWLYQQARPEPGTCTNACRWEYNVQEGKEDDVATSYTSTSRFRCKMLSRRWYRRANRQSLYDRRSPASGRVMTAFEDEHGTYIMNSKDLRASPTLNA